MEGFHILGGAAGCLGSQEETPNRGGLQLSNRGPCRKCTERDQVDRAAEADVVKTSHKILSGAVRALVEASALQSSVIIQHQNL